MGTPKIHFCLWKTISLADKALKTWQSLSACSVWVLDIVRVDEEAGNALEYGVHEMLECLRSVLESK